MPRGPKREQQQPTMESSKALTDPWEMLKRALDLLLKVLTEEEYPDGHTEWQSGINEGWEITIDPELAYLLRSRRVTKGHVGSTIRETKARDQERGSDE